VVVVVMVVDRLINKVVIMFLKYNVIISIVMCNCSVFHWSHRWQQCRICVWSPNSQSCSEVSQATYFIAVTRGYCNESCSLARNRLYSQLVRTNTIYPAIERKVEYKKSSDINTANKVLKNW